MTTREIEVLAAIARLNAEVAGMVAENKMRERSDQGIAYPESAFTKAIEENGLTQNDVIEKLYH